MDDSKIRAMISYIVKYFNENCPENLETMIHFIGHDERYRKRASEITDEIIDNHDEIFIAVSDGKNIEELTPKYAEQCDHIRQKMQKLVEDYLLECSTPN